MIFYKHNRRVRYCSLLVILLSAHQQSYADLTSLAKNDANPPYSTLNMDDSWLLARTQLTYKHYPDAKNKKDRGLFSISPFGQNANVGRGIKGIPCLLPFPGSCPNVVNPTDTTNIDFALGDIGGRSSMLALLYGQIPASYNGTYPGGTMGYLATAAMNLFPGKIPGNINAEQFIDPNQLFAYFSFPLNYRKRGVRFEFDLRVWDDIVIRIQAGASSIRQVVEAQINLTGFATNIPEDPNITTANVNQFLMLQLDNIAKDMKLDIGDLNQASVEEVRFNLCWRHAFNINEDEDDDWSQLLIIPYAEASASASPGNARKPNQLFAVPFGNNGHPSAGFTTGINFDFFDTIEVGGEAGYTHFFKKSFCNFPVPNSNVQTTIFPFQTNVTIQPGNNFHFGLRIAAYHFLYNISTYFEWFVVDHKKDSICLQTPDPAYLPGVLEETTTFKTKMGNFALNWDVSPNLGIGFLWQIPFSQRNTYRSSTIMGGVNITF